MNIAILKGSVVTDPIVQKTPGGRRILKFRLVTANGSNSEGARRPGDLHQIVYWESVYAKDGRFDLYVNHIRKSQRVTVFGKINYQKWISRTDNLEKRATEIVARQIDFPFESSDNASDEEATSSETDSATES